jgi:beta-glucanase (GH16 family)
MDDHLLCRGVRRCRLLVLTMTVYLVIVCATRADVVGRAGGGEFARGVPNRDGWQLVWHDEFDGPELDLNYWDFDLGDGSVVGIPGWGNSELQYYTRDGSNVFLRDSRLVIRAVEERRSDKFGSGRYTSARLVTRGRLALRYGRIEARIKLPVGKGLWPAFWMMPEPVDLAENPLARHGAYGGWAASGEIDIMEAKGSRPGEMSGAIHYGGPWPRNTHQSRTHHFQTGRTIADMNEYAVEWDPGEIRWYVNGQQFFKATQWHCIAPDEKRRPFPAPFDQPFHIILNLAVGGHFDGRPEPAAPYIPAEMEVEYVRAYRRVSAPGAVGDPPDEDAVEAARPE